MASIGARIARIGRSCASPAIVTETRANPLNPRGAHIATLRDTGFESGTVASNFDAVVDGSSKLSLDTLIFNSNNGAQSLKLAASAAANAYGQVTPAGGTRVLTSRFALYIDSYPPTVFAFFRAFTSSGNLELDIDASGIITEAIPGNTFSVVTGLSLATWYWFDVRFDSSASTMSVDFQVHKVSDGSSVLAPAQLTSAGQTPADMTALRAGMSGTGAGLALHFDDLKVTDAGGDYPLGVPPVGGVSWIQPPGRSPAARFATKRGLVMMRATQELLGGLAPSLVIGGAAAAPTTTPFTLTASVTANAAPQWQTLAARAATMSAVSAIARGTAKTYPVATVTAQAAIQRQALKQPAANVTTLAVIGMVKSSLKTLTCLVTVTPFLQRQAVKAQNASVTATPVLQKQALHPLSTNVTASAMLAKQALKALKASVTALAAIQTIKASLKVLSASVTANVNIQKAAGKAPAAAVTATPRITKQVSQQPHAASTMLVVMQRQLPRAFTASITAAASAARQVGKQTSGAASAVAALATQLVTGTGVFVTGMFSSSARGQVSDTAYERRYTETPLGVLDSHPTSGGYAVTPHGVINTTGPLMTSPTLLTSLTLESEG